MLYIAKSENIESCGSSKLQVFARVSEVSMQSAAGFESHSISPKPTTYRSSRSKLWVVVLYVPLFLQLFVTICSQHLCAAVIFGDNLIVNGDAEAGVASTDGNSLVVVPSWSLSGNFVVVAYDTAGGFPLTSSPGPLNRGNNFFAGGPSNSRSSASQVIDVSDISQFINGGSVAYRLSGYLGGYYDQEDYAKLNATFIGANNTILGSSYAGPVSAGDRSYITGLSLRESIGTIPIGTQSIEIEIEMIRTGGSYNDGYADNLSFVLSSSASAVPEPTSMAIFGLGALCLASRARRKSDATSC